MQNDADVNAIKSAMSNMSLGEDVEVKPPAAADDGHAIPMSRTGLVYDERMCKHQHPEDDVFNDPCPDTDHPESPLRIQAIYNALQSQSISADDSRSVGSCMTRVPVTPITEEELCLVHSKKLVNYVQELSQANVRFQREHSLASRSVYVNQHSTEAAGLSAGGVTNLVKAICEGKVKNGLAVVRPPGHHAEEGECHGFCLYNNVAVAAQVAREHLGVVRVLIVDWDVHHGNGTQRMFEEDPSVLFFSAHRWEHGYFYPAMPNAGPDFIGKGDGLGTTINVGWNSRGMGDGDYLQAWQRVLMPAAVAFQPDLVIVSAGFDAAEGDPLGGNRISPTGYAHMMHALMGLAGGRVAVALEGGYNLQSISNSAVACARVLLGHSPPPLDRERLVVSRSGIQDINATIVAHAAKQNDPNLGVGLGVFALPWALAQCSSGVSLSKLMRQQQQQESGSAAKKEGNGSGSEYEYSEPDTSEDEEQEIEFDLDLEAAEETASAQHQARDEEFIAKIKEIEAQRKQAKEQEEEAREENDSGDEGDGEGEGEGESGNKKSGGLGNFMARLAAKKAKQERERKAKAKRMREQILREREQAKGKGKEGQGKEKERGKGKGKEQEGGKQNTTYVLGGGGAAAESSINAEGDEETVRGFQVQPRRSCPHVTGAHGDYMASSVEPLPEGESINIHSKCCTSGCGCDKEIWLCMSCHSTFCGRYQNGCMVTHSEQCRHALALSFDDLSVWCYGCEDYLDTFKIGGIQPLYFEAHTQKFGHPPPFKMKKDGRRDTSGESEDNATSASAFVDGITITLDVVQKD